MRWGAGLGDRSAEHGLTRDGETTAAAPLFSSEDSSRVAAIMNRLAADARDPLAVSMSVQQDSEFSELDDALRQFVSCLLALELDETKTAVVELVFGWSSRRVPNGTLQDEMDGQASFLRALLATMTTTLLRGLLSDVILSARHDPSPEHALETVRAYLAVAQEASTDSYHAALAISRANTIARSRRLTVEKDVRDEASAFASRALNNPEPPGVTALVLELLSVAPTYANSDAAAHDELVALLDDAERRYPDPSSADWIADCRRRIALDASEHAEATARQVNAYLAIAKAESHGFRKMHWASAAAELAERHGAMEMRDAAVRLMQAIPPESMEWKSIEYEVPVPTSSLRRHVRRFRLARDWRQGLQIFLASPSPAGSHEKNVKTSQAAAAGSIRNLVTNAVFGAHGLPEQNDADFLEGELIRTEEMELRVRGIVLDMELREVQDRFGLPGADVIADWLSAMYDSDISHCRHFARAIELHLAGDQASSARLSIPLIESCARSLLLRLNEPLYRIERGSTPGKFPAMDFYLTKLDDLGLDPDWSRALRTTLLGRGLNLRNLSAHGFMFDFSRADSALLIRLAGLFVAMPIPPDAAEASGLSTPLSAVRAGLRATVRRRFGRPRLRRAAG